MMLKKTEKVTLQQPSFVALREIAEQKPITAHSNNTSQENSQLSHNENDDNQLDKTQSRQILSQPPPIRLQPTSISPHWLNAQYLQQIHQNWDSPFLWPRGFPITPISNAEWANLHSINGESSNHKHKHNQNEKPAKNNVE